MQYIKQDDNTLKAIKTIEEITTYEYGFLESQKEWFENEVIKNQAEITKIKALLVECDKLGIIEK